MARLFSTGSPDVRVAIGPSSGETWDPVTTMAVVRRGGDTTIDCILAVDTSAPATQGHVGIMDGDQMLYNHQGASFAADGPTVLAANGWCLLAWTKPVGVAVVRYHKIVLNTGVITHANSATTFGSITTPGVGGFWRVGNNSFSEPFEGDIAAVCCLRRALTDSEIEGARRGDWWRFSPTFHREFPSGPDRLVLGRNIGRDGTRDTLLTSTFRSAVRDPPGFRFSPATRRGR